MASYYVSFIVHGYLLLLSSLIPSIQINPMMNFTICIPLAISLLCCTCCFFPNFFGIHFNNEESHELNHNDLALREAHSSLAFKYSLVGCFAASLPTFLDYSVDSISMLSKLWHVPIISISKSAAVMSVLIPNAVTFFFLCDTSQGFEYAPAIILTQMNIILVAFCLSICHYGAPVWTWRNTSVLVFFHGIGIVASTFDAFLSSWTLSFFYIKMISYILTSIVGIWLTVLWMKHLLRHKSFSAMTHDEYCCNIHLFGACTFLFSFWSISIIYPESWPETSRDCLCVLNYVLSSVTILLVMAHARVTRREADVEQVNRELMMKSTFVRYVSHEIRTPLNTLSMGLTVLKDELSQNLRHRDWVVMVEDLERSCDTSVDILNSLLTYEKLTTNILELEKKLLLVRSFVSDTVHPFLLEARAKQVNFRMEFEGVLQDSACPITINLDKSKVSQVVRNLLSNALKFTKEGGDVQVRVGVDSRTDDVTSEPPQASQRRLALDLTSFLPTSVVNRLWGTRRQATYSTDGPPARVLRLQVTDSGPGISEENQKRLFKEIVQFNPGELQDGKGSGLGLWISHQIVGLHHGKLSVYSAGIGHGSTFTLELPLEQDSGDGAADVAPNTQSGAGPQERLVAAAAGVNLNESPSTVGISSRSRALNAARVHPTAQALAPGSVANQSSREASAREPPCNADEKEDRDEIHNQGRLDGSRQQGICDYDVTDSALETHRLANLIPAARVLVVDDVELNRKMAIRLLRHVWTDFSEAEDGEEALRLVQSASESGLPMDLVLMDYQMPTMDGPTAAKAMRAMGYNGIIIGVTGNGLQQDIDHFISQGANKVLIKPLRREALRDCLESVLSES